MKEPSGGKPALGERLDLSESSLPIYRQLREKGSIIPNDGIVPIPAQWVATDQEAVSYVLRHSDEFSSTGQTRLGNVRPLIPLEVDPPEHVRYRRLLDPFFSPTKLRELEPALRDQINDFIDGFINRGSVELISEFFVPYPTQVFLTLFGLPLEDRSMFLRWKEDISHNSIVDPEAGKRAFEELSLYMHHFIDGHDSGGSDLLSQLITPDGLTVEEILDVTALLLMAGLETVTIGLTLGFAYLARHSEQRRALVEEPALIPGAVEELLRISTPAPALERRATHDIDLYGATIRKDEFVFCHLGAANGDSARIPDAETVDFRREKNPHSSFGSGIHRCLGSHLARLEIRLVIEEFHKRIPDYELAPDADMVKVPFYEGLERLPITFVPPDI